jgi:hypothetical protein
MKFDNFDKVLLVFFVLTSLLRRVKVLHTSNQERVAQNSTIVEIFYLNHQDLL